MKTETLERLRSRITKIDAIPAIPLILRPLLHCLDQPVEDVDVNRVVELVSYDKSIAAQCVRMANSALFMRSTPAESVRSAVMSLGLWRVRDLLFSNSLSQVIPANRWVIDPSVFWRHSLGVALVCRKLAEMIEYPDSEKAYLAGLLHDIGVLVNCMVAPEEFRATMEKATREQIPLDEAEQATLGFTHSDSGRSLPRPGKFPLKSSTPLSFIIGSEIQIAGGRWSRLSTSATCFAGCAIWAMATTNPARWTSPMSRVGCIWS